MAPSFWKPLRAALETERSELSRQLKRLGATPADRDGLALAQTMRETMLELDAALKKLTAGTYGTCEQCGGPISQARLEQLPAARRCFTCADESAADPSEDRTELGMPVFKDGQAAVEAAARSARAEAAPTTLKVWIDQDACTGDGRCARKCPGVFAMIDGRAYVKEGARVFAAARGELEGPEGLATVPEQLSEAVIECAEACPAECIFVEVS